MINPDRVYRFWKAEHKRYHKAIHDSRYGPYFGNPALTVARRFGITCREVKTIVRERKQHATQH